MIGKRVNRQGGYSLRWQRAARVKSAMTIAREIYVCHWSPKGCPWNMVCVLFRLQWLVARSLLNLVQFSLQVPEGWSLR